MALLTVQQFKVLTGLKGTEHDSRIEALIPFALADYEALSGSSLGGEYSDGVNLTLSVMVSYLLNHLGKDGIGSHSSGGVSTSLETGGSYGYPPSVLKRIPRVVRPRE